MYSLSNRRSNGAKKVTTVTLEDQFIDLLGKMAEALLPLRMLK